MGLFKKVISLLGFGRKKALFTGSVSASIIKKDENVIQHRKAVKTGNRVPFVSWGSFTLMLREPYR